MGYEYEVRERIFLTSDKRVVVSADDKLAHFLLAPPGPVSPMKAKQISSYKHGKAFLFKVTAPKAEKPGEDKARAPGDDKAGNPEGDKSSSPVSFGPDDVVDFGAKEGQKVRDLPDGYLKNLARVSTEHRTWAQAELDRRAEAD